jgi:hypothetical protein
VAALHTAAAAAPPGPGGEPDRGRFRAVARSYLADAGREARGELVQRVSALGPPAGGFELALALAEDPAERRSLAARWARLEADVEPALEGWLEARAEAARRAGAEGTAAFLEAEQVGPIAVLVERLRRGAIEPLDGPVSTAVREVAEASDVARSDAPPAAVLRRTLERLGTGLGLSREGRGPRLVEDPAAGAFSQDFATAVAAIRLGRLGGPLALARALDAFGAAARVAFLRERRHPSWIGADPAFDHAARALFRRLAISPAFVAWVGGEYHPSVVRALRLEEALAPRRAWTYLLLACQARSSREGPGRVEIAETLEQVTFRPANPLDASSARRGDPSGAGELRGMTLAALVEERLLTRHGSRWFLDRSAATALQEWWEAEPGETAESMAAASDVGTIEPTPLLDRYRP